MELKSGNTDTAAGSNIGSNRTFMELKSTKEMSDVYPWAF